ncbi:unnamed protein product [Choristocarpus tenellus]
MDVFAHRKVVGKRENRVFRRQSALVFALLVVHGGSFSVSTRVQSVRGYRDCQQSHFRGGPRRAIDGRAFEEVTPVSSPDSVDTPVKVIVKRIARNPVDPSQLLGYGTTFNAKGREKDNDEEWVLMQTISGVTDAGREVIAVVEPGKISPGGSVDVDHRSLVTKPGGLDWERAAMLPFLVVNCLCPLSAVGFEESTTAGKSCVVTGGHGSLAPFVAQVLKNWGAKVWCVTTNKLG